jgi:hypothetical protein
LAGWAVQGVERADRRLLDAVPVHSMAMDCLWSCDRTPVVRPGARYQRSGACPSCRARTVIWPMSAAGRFGTVRGGPSAADRHRYEALARGITHGALRPSGRRVRRRTDCGSRSGWGCHGARALPPEDHGGCSSWWWQTSGPPGHPQRTTCRTAAATAGRSSPAGTRGAGAADPRLGLHRALVAGRPSVLPDGSISSDAVPRPEGGVKTPASQATGQAA